MKFFTSLCVMILLLTGLNAEASFEKGSKLKKLKLQGDQGGLLDGTPWSSEEMLGKIAIFYYVDPDEKDKNEPLSEALKKRDFSSDYVRFYAMINMEATWLPNFAISSSLKSKQEKYPTTVYLKDYDKIGVQKWGLADDENNVVAFDAEGRVLFSKFGRLDQGEIAELLSLIEQEIANIQGQDS